MEMRAVLFKNGRRVCPIGQGTYLMGRRRSEEVRALRRSVELGMEVIDTAEMYGTEDLVGEAVRGCREKAFLVSKVLPENADYAGTKRACEGSLRRLGTDYIDLYLLHWKGSFPISETVRAMAELKREGKILQWGMSNLDVGDMRGVLSLPDGGDCAADQVLYNMESRGAEYDLIPWCARRGIPIMGVYPFRGRNGDARRGAGGNSPPALRHPHANHVGMDNPRRRNRDSESGGSGACGGKFPQS